MSVEKHVWISKEFSKEFPIIIPLSFLRTKQQHKTNLPGLPDYQLTNQFKV